MRAVTARSDDYDSALDRAVEHAKQWLASVPDRQVGPLQSADEVLLGLGGPLPEEGLDAAAVVDELANGAEPGLMAIQSGRFFGWVMGGTLPAALASDWLVSAWDQNAGLRFATPAVVAIEEVAGRWLLELLGLPLTADVGFVTGATMANFAGLAAARSAVLGRVGWDVSVDGLSGAPAVHVLVGAERHDTIDLALRYLGLGRPRAVAADSEGRIELSALSDALDAIPDGEPIIVCLQAGNLHSGAFDPFEAAIAMAHRRGAWVHVDGAFGLWAGASPSLRPLVRGFEAADSWATDAHKTLNVPYDCGIAIVAESTALRSALGVHADYLISDRNPGPGDPLREGAGALPTSEGSADVGGHQIPWPPRSHQARREHGRDGALLAREIELIDGAEVLNDVVYTQVCVSFGDDGRTSAVTDRIIRSGTTWMSGSRWQGRSVLRISVSNWSTSEQDVRASVDAVRQAMVG